MDIAGGPAALGGVMMCVTMIAWALGRWQGGLLASPDRGASPAGEAAPALRLSAGSWPNNANPLPAVPVRHAQPWPVAAHIEDRSAELATASSLARMHDDISAYRRAQQVLTELRCDALEMIASQGSARDECCASSGASGEGLCAAPCTCKTDCRNAARVSPSGRADQPPALVPAGLARV